MSNLTLNFQFVQPEVSPAWMIGARTHLVDCWEPQLEWIRMPKLLFENRTYHASVAEVDQHTVLKEYRLQKRFNASVKESVRIEEPFYDVRAHGTNNIAHAILGGAMETLACQFAANFLGLNCPVTAVISSKTASYVKEVYRILGIPTLITEGIVFGQKFQTDLDDSARIGLANQLLPNSLAEQLEVNAQNLPRRIYLARQGARSISNTDEVEVFLQREGFTKIYPEELPVIEQFRYLWHADVVVGVHGAALAALLFRVLKRDRKPMHLLELFGPGYVVSLYRHVVAAIGGQWIGVRGRVTPHVVKDLDVLQGSGFWDELSSKLRGRLPGRFLKKEWAWQRTHQSTNFEIDPESLTTALDLLQAPSTEPHPRLVKFE
jgi:hypothetical protein